VHAVTKIGIYGGTFDPIHHAHLILAREALETLGLAEVIFVPAALSPHKLDCTPTPAAIRMDMLRAALAGEPRFTIDEVELKRPPPSFTIDTIEAFAQSKPETQMHYLIGSDNLPRLHTWHRIDDLRKLVQFVVLERGEKSEAAGIITIHRHLDISATQIRNRVASGQSIRYLVPPPVEEIIRREQLYKEPTRSPRKN
jgi:nicotinate-nucleotide adenylyltransferase